MAKELPYFKFFVSEWSDGDITLEKYAVQGLFANLCSYYWSKKCEVTLEKASKKYKNADKLFDILINSKIIKIKNDFIVIDFLDEQRIERDCKILINRENGAKGGRPKNPTKTQKEPTGLISLTETKGNKKRKEERKEEEKRKDKTTETSSVYDQIKSHFIKKFFEVSEVEYYFNAIDGKKIKSIISKINHAYKSTGVEKPTDDQIFNGFSHILERALKDKWLHDNLTLANIDSQFNKLKIKKDDKDSQTQRIADRIINQG